MSKCLGIENFEEQMNKAWDEADKELKAKKAKLEPFLEQARKSIKHPHFYYAILDEDTKEITYKRKKWYKWFSGKRIAYIKFKIRKFVCTDLGEYKPMKTDYFIKKEELELL